PTSAVGNGRVISTLGGAGEIMTFFYPRLDFAQNIEECMPMLYLGDPGHGRMVWTFDPSFARDQYYLPDTNILVTELLHQDTRVRITFTDFCPPGSTALVRLVRIENTSEHEFGGAFGHYFDFRLGEVWGKQAVGYDPACGCFLQYFRGTAVAVGGTAPEQWRVGKSIRHDLRSAKQDLEDGHLSGQSEDIGRVNFSGLRRVHLQPGETDSFWIVIAAGSSREEAMAELRRLKDLGPDRLLQTTTDYWTHWLSRREPLHLDPEFEYAYRRALLSLAMLQDETTGSFIAAPEFDPGYERCGGYGYCWPRDASESAEGLAEAGYPEHFHRLCEWYKLAQLPNGLWGQRHWADGQVAASWALRTGFEQLDQTAAALVSICHYITSAPQEQRSQRLTEYWEAIERGARGLQEEVDERGLHRHACDLWETYCGIFVYTNAAFARAFVSAAACARLADRQQLAEEWQHVAGRLKEACKNLYNGVYFPRGFKESGALDDAVDTSSLGLAEPWCVLSPHDPQERHMILTNLQEIERRLRQPVPAQYPPPYLTRGVSALSDSTDPRSAGLAVSAPHVSPASAASEMIGLRRFEGDVYLDGVVGCVNTLWAAQIYLRLAQAEQGDKPDEARDFRNRAIDYIRLSLARATPTGLLPELIGLQPDTPYWAIPHGWASSLMVHCLHLLDATRALET
ncbi:MAG: glycoside hydrolase family 15 protein, partial [Armatimonadia bacterium]